MKNHLILLLLMLSFPPLSSLNSSIDTSTPRSTRENPNQSYTPMTCNENLIQINTYTCAENNDFAVPSKCPTGQECWDGKCEVEVANKCPTMTSCPPSLNTRCSDNSCVYDKTECPNYFNCPSFIPIRCPNGDCRKSLEDCPSLLRCPSQFSIHCNDGSCRMTKEKCQLPAEQTQCVDQSMTRCADGTCVSAKFLCPTAITCPIGYVLCWDGQCAKEEDCAEPELTQSNTCSDETKIVCGFDYSCRSHLSLCPTGILCPVDKPVRCWDNSCKESIASCPAYQDCPSGMKGCPDGSCTTKTCGMHITCSVDAPFRCYDNTCRKNPEDCPSQPNCPSETPILCWDGRCLANREECTPPSSYPESTTGVKCPNGMFKKSVEECKQTNECPTGFSKCPDGTCRQRLVDCEKQECPLSFSYLCRNGMCVSEESHCEHENGCPFNKPQKCKDGSCIKAGEECPNYTVVQCESGSRLCPDGSCLPYTVTCRNENGCPVDTPRRCADGNCIDPKKANCSIPICPSESPIRCLDGTCVTTKANCPKVQKSVNEEGLVLCADGIAVHSFEECKPLLLCKSSEERCQDGTCRESADYCPKAQTCPGNLKYRCSNGQCSSSQEYCVNSSGCPNKNPIKCPSSGLCVDNMDKCEVFGLANACPKEFPFKCSSGKCVESDKDENCEEDVGCPSTTPVMCLNGLCVDNLRFCEDTEECAQQLIGCPTDNVVGCAKSLDECYNSNNCKLSTPFRCPNGECKRYPKKEEDNLESQSCSIAIQCPEARPFLCENGQCVERSTFCPSLDSCEEDEVRCFDRTCAKSQQECNEKRNKCPAKSPILCPNSNCVSSFFECSGEKCPTWKPYKCINGFCKESPAECFYNATSKGENDKFVTYCDPDDEVACSDGTCRKSLSECPLYAGCSTTALPYKCPNGKCVALVPECSDSKTIYTCGEGEKKCEDGICRKECPEYNGCPFNAPLMCSTGRCVKLIAECVGEGNCPEVEKPFRCIDGSCAATITECKSPMRNFGSTDITLSVYPSVDYSTDIVKDNNNLATGSLYIPSDALLKNNESVEGKIIIKSVPRSKVAKTFSKYNQTRTDDVIRVFPYADSNSTYQLEYEYTVLSTVVEIELEDKEVQFKSGLLLKLTYDFPEKHESMKIEDSTTKDGRTITHFKHLDKLKDVCLGELGGNEWKCHSHLDKTQSLDNLVLQGTISRPGIFAVILYPEINVTPLDIEDNYLVKHLLVISILVIVILLVVGIGLYVFWRIYRYRAKYKETSRKAKEFQIEMNEMQESSSGNAGQTIGDSKEGVVFTDNPAFKMVRDEGKSKRTLQLEKLYDYYAKRLRTLERNNEKLKESLDSTKKNYENLKEYKGTLQKRDSTSFVINPNENQEK